MGMTSVVKEMQDISIKEIKYLIGKESPVILEIGANIGQTTLEFLKEMPDAKIYCFEPDPRAISFFKSNVSVGNVTLVESAVGNENGFVMFNQSSGVDEYMGWNQSGSIRNPKEHTDIWPKVIFEEKIEVPIVRLDDWAKENNIEAVDFIWADTQGAESDLILGGMETLAFTRYFYTEYGFRELYDGQVSLSEIVDLLPEFCLKRLFPMDALFENIKLNKNNKIMDQIIPRVGRNDRCLCGSGRKYKQCHGALK